MTGIEDARPAYALRPWKIVVFVAAGVLVAAGGVLAITSGGGGAPDSAVGGTDIPGARSFGAGGLPADLESGSSADDEGSPWSPALLRGGISFFAAFVLAFALRTFLRIAMLFLGVWAGSLFLLSSAGWIDIHWAVIDDQFVAWTHALGDQFESFRAFLTGSLPSAGMAGLGLFTGFRRG